MINLSIGIPTYERPVLLKRLLNSITNQDNITHYQIEILIGDDSKKSYYPALSDLISQLPVNIIIQYKHHTIAKGQNDNVASLIERAKSKYFCLMHDDDYFLEGALKTLLNAAIENLNCIVFGKQLVLTDQYDYKSSEGTNDFFKRNAAHKGKQKDSIAMAMLQQCPNDGYILPTASAKQIGIRPKSIVGTACDFDFALRAAIEAKLDFFYVDQYTTVYAVTDESVTTSSTNNGGERKLQALYEFNTNITHPKIFHQVLKADLSMIISHYILINNIKAAKENLFSFKNFFNYLWYKPATYRQLFTIIFNKR